MRLAMRLPKKGDSPAANDIDPREQESAEIIDLASRNAFPAVTQRKGRSDGLGMAAGIAFIGALGAITLWAMSSARMEPAEGVGGQQPGAQAAAVQPVTLQPVQEVPAAPPVPPQAVTSVGYTPAPSGQPVYAAPPQGAVAAAPAADPYASPTLVYDSGQLVSAAPAPTATTPAAGDNAAAAGSGAGDFAARIGGVGGGTAQARAMVNPQTTVTQGTLIPAVLETAINTDVPGFVRAVVSQDVKSFDGSRVLVPRSSRLIGQYQSGLQGGQRRAYVIWTRLIRPDGASVNIASPAVGFDGTTGLAGEVNSHFFRRFGSAMLMSVISGLSTLGTGGAGVVLGGGQSAAAAALQQDGNIAPTVRVRQGEPIRVFTARDLDFSAVTGG